jgi:hypothetical protein
MTTMADPIVRWLDPTGSEMSVNGVTYSLRALIELVHSLIKEAQMIFSEDIMLKLPIPPELMCQDFVDDARRLDKVSDFQS